MKLLLLTIFLISSPIWPLGQNPLVGDPYVIINKQTNRLAYIDNGEIIREYPVATGQTETLTPEGEFSITVKAIDPYYRKKDIPGGDPKNPLGTRWIGFNALDTDGRTYGIHGTNNENSIGYYMTQGCVRMHNEEVEELFEHLPVGTKIRILKSEKPLEDIAIEEGVVKKGDSN
ncbi:L,D-transpeptidase [Metabacillus herbersteinensis]|uniref:L,D-transpeptidase n=1 Tax=Metabacillus herbersteinensis TaxID=283816 RepID=A0ABV6G8K4_9BACI